MNRYSSAIWMELFPLAFGPRTKLNRSRSKIVSLCDRKFLKVRVVIRIGFSIAIAHYWFCRPTGGTTGFRNDRWWYFTDKGSGLGLRETGMLSSDQPQG